MMNEEKIFITKKDGLYIVSDEKCKDIIKGNMIVFLDNDVVDNFNSKNNNDEVIYEK